MFQTFEDEPFDRQHLRTLRIIVASLVGGCGVFFAIALFAGESRGWQLAPGDMVITLVAAGFAGSAIVVRQIAVGAVTAQGCRRVADRHGVDLADPAVRRGLWGVFQTKTIIGSALLEGAAFFALISYLAEGSPLALVLAGLLIVGIALQMPSRGRVAGWMEAQVRRMEEERPLGR